MAQPSAPTASPPAANASAANASAANASAASAPAVATPAVSATAVSAPAAIDPAVIEPTASAPVASTAVASTPTASAPPANAPPANALPAPAPTANPPALCARLDGGGASDGAGVARRRRQLVVVGAGRFGTKLAREALSLGALAALVDPSLEALARAHAALGAPEGVGRFRALAAALAAHGDAAVAVAAPAAAHFAPALAALRAGRDVWVEKPLCTRVADAEALAAAAAAAQAVLFVDHTLRYSAPHRAALALAAAGWAGTVTRVRARRLNFGTVRAQENVLWSFCPHDVSLALAACGGGGALPRSVACAGEALVTPGVHDCVDVRLAFAGGATASIEASWLHHERERRLAIYGTKGAIVVNEPGCPPSRPRIEGFQWSTKRRADGAAVAAEIAPVDMRRVLADAGIAVDAEGEGQEHSSPLRNALLHFFECCETRAQPLTDGAEGVRVLRVLLAAQESLEGGAGAPVLLDAGGGHETAGAGGAVEGHTSLPTPPDTYFKHATAVVDAGAEIGEGSRIWHFSHVMGGAQVGAGCNVGQNVYIAATAVLGRNVKVQNGVSVYDGVVVDDDAFLGPHCVFTNVKTPRAHVSRRAKFLGTWVGRGATVGAGATVLCGLRLGAYCMVGAGAVVTRDVPAHALVYGNPARVRGWVATTGKRLIVVANIGGGRQILQCSESKEVYHLFPGTPEGEQPHLVRDEELKQERKG